MDDVNGDPSSWEEALVRAGYTDRRGGNGPSWSALAEKLGVHTSTLTGMRDGANTDSDTVWKVAKALGIRSQLAAEWMGWSKSEPGPYEPSGDADLLNQHEREAVNRIISLLAEAKKGSGSSVSTSKPRKKSPNRGSGGRVVAFLNAQEEAADAYKGEDSEPKGPHEDE